MEPQPGFQFFAQQTQPQIPVPLPPQIQAAEESSPNKRKLPEGSATSTPKKRKVNTKFAKQLRALEKEQLVELFLHFAEDPKYASLKDDLLKHFPDADLTAIKNEIQKLRNAISRAFPNARYGNNRDDFAFKRVKPTITPFKKAITENSKRLKDAQNWSSFVEYLEFAIDEVLSMPHFDAEKNNKARDGLLKHLNTQYEQMLKVKNLGLEKDELEEIKETITRANDRSGSFAGALAACEKRLQ